MEKCVSNWWKIVVPRQYTSQCVGRNSKRNSIILKATGGKEDRLQKTASRQFNDNNRRPKKMEYDLQTSGEKITVNQVKPSVMNKSKINTLLDKNWERLLPSESP